MAKIVCLNCVGDGRIYGKVCKRCKGSGYEPAGSK